MGSATPKQFLTLGGVPLLVHTLRALESAEEIVEIILAVPEADREFCLREIVTPHRLTKVRRIVAGGAQRQDSVRHGLQAVSDGIEFVLVHDAVRPFVTREMIRLVIEAAAKHGAALVAIPMKDTVKQVGPDGLVESTVDRGRLWLAQTPQAFRRSLFEEAHRKAELEGLQGTDDTQLVERLGYPVAIVEGSGENIKITRPEDFAIGEAILAARCGRRE
ncbi:MAG: 2-C-methyl-D-erythritol 4-phosphate cytidylyltransferase [Nitrospirota bacterium]|nr:2-C-methyl-D-erythritol 4-phosphate cytidylyltransferase [Nitrospirota bacterium]MDE3117796.1 2-C-methyl-D-erythritol 4-phosphate cytidylyltransferase [Nitrospirota bacterium]MDE3243575.1 2-C-methyl-D-erythritol 4-phosphate cytidylyltransferase [Nitrospirota bacterium]